MTDAQKALFDAIDKDNIVLFCKAIDDGADINYYGPVPNRFVEMSVFSYAISARAYMILDMILDIIEFPEDFDEKVLGPSLIKIDDMLFFNPNDPGNTSNGKKFKMAARHVANTVLHSFNPRDKEILDRIERLVKLEQNKEEVKMMSLVTEAKKVNKIRISINEAEKIKAEAPDCWMCELLSNNIKKDSTSNYILESVIKDAEMADHLKELIEAEIDVEGLEGDYDNLAEEMGVESDEETEAVEQAEDEENEEEDISDSEYVELEEPEEEKEELIEAKVPEKVAYKNIIEECKDVEDLLTYREGERVNVPPPPKEEIDELLGKKFTCPNCGGHEFVKTETANIDPEKKVCKTCGTVLTDTITEAKKKKKEFSDKMESCVKAVKEKEGEDGKVNPWAVCTASLKKAGTPIHKGEKELKEGFLFNKTFKGPGRKNEIEKELKKLNITEQKQLNEWVGPDPVALYWSVLIPTAIWALFEATKEAGKYITYKEFESYPKEKKLKLLEDAVNVLEYDYTPETFSEFIDYMIEVAKPRFPMFYKATLKFVAKFGKERAYAITKRFLSDKILEISEQPGEGQLNEAKKKKKAEKTELWMQEAVPEEHKGKLHKRLGIPEDENIPVKRIKEELSKLKKKKEARGEDAKYTKSELAFFRELQFALRGREVHKEAKVLSLEEAEKKFNLKMYI